MKVDIKGAEEIELSLQKIGAGAVDIAKRAVNAAAPTLRDSLKDQITKTTNGKGDLADSITLTPALENDWGVYAKVAPSGVDRRGTANIIKLRALEYGRKGGYHSRSGFYVTDQEPKPVMAKSVAAVEDKVVKIMEDIVGEEIDKLFD